MRQNEKDEFYIQKMLEHCERIESAVSRFGDNFDVFTKDLDYRDVICMNVFQIGELSNQVSDDFKQKNHNVPWEQMYGIRNRLARAYITIDDSIIWGTVKNDIPKLVELISNIM